MAQSLLQKTHDWLMKTRWRARVSLIISGGVYPLAFSPIDIWPLAFVSLIFLLLALIKEGPFSGFKVGFYWGLGCFSVGASWVYVSVHNFGHAPWPGATLLTLGFVMYLALFKACFGYLCSKLLKLSQLSLFVLIAPMAWLFSEYLQSVVFNGFPWLLVGYSQIDSPLSGVALWLGVFGVSWFTVAIAASVTIIINCKVNRGQWAVLAILLCIVFTAGFEQNSMRQETNGNNIVGKQDNKFTSVDVALVQPNIPQEQKWDRRFFAKIIDNLMSESEQLWNADIVIWPEGAIPAYAHQVNDIIYDLTQKTTANDSHLIFGIPEYEADSKLSFVTLKAVGVNQQSYQKQVLVPFGEYVPLENWLRGVIKFFDLPMSGFSPALTMQAPMLFKNFSVIPAICYEIVYPNIIRNLSLQAEANELPQMIVTVSNDAWFGDSLGPYQHMQMARMRALELGLPLVRSTNDGITAMVDAHGSIIEQLPRYQQGSLRASVSINNIPTFYRRWGPAGVSFVLLISGIFIALSAWRKHKRIRS